MNWPKLRPAGTAYDNTPEEMALIAEDMRRWTEARTALKPLRQAKQIKDASRYRSIEKARQNINQWLARMPPDRREDMRRRINRMIGK